MAWTSLFQRSPLPIEYIPTARLLVSHGYEASILLFGTYFVLLQAGLVLKLRQQCVGDHTHAAHVRICHGIYYGIWFDVITGFPLWFFALLVTKIWSRKTGDKASQHAYMWDFCRHIPVPCSNHSGLLAILQRTCLYKKQPHLLIQKLIGYSMVTCVDHH